MSEIINNNSRYVIQTDGKIYVKLGNRYIALIDDEGNLNIKLKNYVELVNSLSEIDSDGIYAYNNNIYAYVNGSRFLLSGGAGGAADVVDELTVGEYSAVTSNAVALALNERIKVYPYNGSITTSSLAFELAPANIAGSVKWVSNMKCFAFEKAVVSGQTPTCYLFWNGWENYQTRNVDTGSLVRVRTDVIFLNTSNSTISVCKNGNTLNTFTSADSISASAILPFIYKGSVQNLMANWDLYSWGILKNSYYNNNNGEVVYVEDDLGTDGKASKGTFLYKVAASDNYNYRPEIKWLNYCNLYNLWEGYEQYVNIEEEPFYNYYRSAKSTNIYLDTETKKLYYFQGEHLEEIITEPSFAENNHTVNFLTIVDSVPGTKYQYTGNDGIPVYVSDRNTFYYKVSELEGNTTVVNYYEYWPYRNLYINSQGYPKEDVLYFCQGNSKLYLYDGDEFVDIKNGIEDVYASELGMLRLSTQETKALEENGYDSVTQNMKGVGINNIAILKNFIETTYKNLILDGNYLLWAPYDYHGYNEDNTIMTEGFHKAPVIRRKLKISGGKIFHAEWLFSLNKGGSLICENIGFENVALYAYRPLRICPEDGVIDSLEFINCRFNAHTDYAKEFSLTSVNKQIAPLNVDLKRKWDTTLLTDADYYGISDHAVTVAIFDSDTDCVYGFSSDYLIVESTDDEGKVTQTLYQNNSEIIPSNYDALCYEKHSINSYAYKKDPNGDYWFIEYNEGTDIHDAKSGYYVKASEYSAITTVNENGVTLTLTTVHKENGNVVLYSQLEIPNIADDPTGVMKVDKMGINIFRMVNCIGNKVRFSLGNIGIFDVFEVAGCIFNNCDRAVFSIGSDTDDFNNYPYATSWVRSSCQLVFRNCIFNGVEGVPMGDSYKCGILSEANSIWIKGCSFRNFTSTKFPAYETYLSCREVIFEDNHVYNVFPGPQISKVNNHYVLTIDHNGNSVGPVTNYEWMKSKGGTKVNGKPILRIYRNNKYEIDRTTAWLMCKDFFYNFFPKNQKDFAELGYNDNTKGYVELIYESERESLMEKYPNEHDLLEEEYENYLQNIGYDLYVNRMFDGICMRVRFFGFISGNVIENVIVENNIFKAPDCRLIQGTLSGRTSYLQNVSIQNNTFEFKEFAGDLANTLNNPLVAFRKPITIGKTPELHYPNLTINNNIFTTSTPEEIQLFSVDNFEMGTIKIQNNTFNNCSIRASNYNGGVGRQPIVANEVRINSNVYNLNKGIPTYINLTSALRTHTDTQALRAYGDPFMFRSVGYNTTNSISNVNNIEIVDRLDKGVSAESEKLLYLPSSINSKLTIRTPYMCRPIAKITDDSSVAYGMIDINNDKSLVVLQHNYPDFFNYFIDVLYTIKGLKKFKHLEIIGMPITSGVSGSGYPARTTRDINGLIYSEYLSSNAFFYNGGSTTNRAVNAYELGSIDEIGLNFFVENYGAERGSSTNSKGGRYLFIYTDENGTTNDPGTDIIITVIPSLTGGEMPMHSTSNYFVGPLTPLSTFIPSGSVVSREWFDEIRNGWEIALNGSSPGLTSINATTEKYIKTVFSEELFSNPTLGLSQSSTAVVLNDVDDLNANLETAWGTAYSNGKFSYVYNNGVLNLYVLATKSGKTVYANYIYIENALTWYNIGLGTLGSRRNDYINEDWSGIPQNLEIGTVYRGSYYTDRYYRWDGVKWITIKSGYNYMTSEDIGMKIYVNEDRCYYTWNGANWIREGSETAGSIDDSLVRIEYMTLEEYDELDSKNNNTLYFIYQ